MDAAREVVYDTGHMRDITLKNKIARLLNDPSAPYFMLINDMLAVLTVVSVLAVALGTVHPLQVKYDAIFYGIELVVLVSFTIEYLLRVWTAERRLAYMRSFFGIVDLLSIIPVYLMPWTGASTLLRKIRILRVLRLLRTLRCRAMYAKSMRRRVDARAAQRETRRRIAFLNVEIYFTALFASIFLLATIMFVAEGDRSEFANIPLAILWVAEMIFGGSISGILPATQAGIIIAIVTRFVGLALFGLLIMIIGNVVSNLLFGADLAEVEAGDSEENTHP